MINYRIIFQKFILIICICFCIKAKSQNANESISIEDHSIELELYTKCFENLNQGAEILEKYPAFKETKLCSLAYCMMLLSYQDQEIQKISKDRLIGITTQLYRQGNPVILIMGIESSLEAEKRNENLDDDDHIVYISYGECTNLPFLREGAEIVNKQTRQLIKQNSLK